MLVLSRRLQQQIVIDQRITITILGVKGKTVRVGIEAPQDCKILRREIELELDPAQWNAPPSGAEAAPQSEPASEHAAGPPETSSVLPLAPQGGRPRATRRVPGASPHPTNQGTRRPTVRPSSIPTEWRLPDAGQGERASGQGPLASRVARRRATEGDRLSAPLEV